MVNTTSRRWGTTFQVVRGKSKQNRLKAKASQRYQRQRSDSRTRSIETPPRRDRVAATKREELEPMPHEVIMRKAEALGVACWCDVRTHECVMDGDPQKAVDALTVLRYRKEISHLEYRAGLEYARLHRGAFGLPFPKNAAYTETLADAPDTEDYSRRILTDAEREAKQEMDYRAYHEAIKWLETVARHVGVTVWNVCVAGQMIGPEYHESLRIGLRQLDRCFARRQWL